MAEMTSEPAAEIVDDAPRRVRLSLVRVDVWSVMKISFMLSVAFAIVQVVAAALLWVVLNAMHVFGELADLVESIGVVSLTSLLEYLHFSRVVAMATVIGVVNVLLLTALATVGALLYNIIAALVGGIRMTLTDD